MPALTVQHLCDAMDAIAPPRYAEPWDKVGLHIGDPGAPITGPAPGGQDAGPVLLTIDLTERVMAEAEALNAPAVVAYHPPIWTPLDRLTTATPAQRIARRAVASNTAIYSPHTALDAARGGITDWLCEGIAGLPNTPGTPAELAADVRALRPHPEHRKTQEVKLVTFVPAEAVENVRNALATAGAGRIGNYDVCSFALVGTGTFLAKEGASPVVGRAGALESVAEHRLEMVCSRAALPLAIETLRQFHPYEEPPIDVYELVAQPHRGSGPGRRVSLDRPATATEIARRLKGFLAPARVKVAALPPELAGGPDDSNGDGDTPEPALTRVGVVPGAGGSMLPDAIDAGCEAFVTGEMKHHEVLAALAAGVRVVLAGHTNTERGYLPRLAARLAEALPEARFAVSETDRDPLTVQG